MKSAHAPDEPGNVPTPPGEIAGVKVPGGTPMSHPGAAAVAELIAEALDAEALDAEALDGEVLS